MLLPNVVGEQFSFGGTMEKARHADLRMCPHEYSKNKESVSVLCLQSIENSMNRSNNMIWSRPARDQRCLSVFSFVVVMISTLGISHFSSDRKRRRPRGPQPYPNFTSCLRNCVVVHVTPHHGKRCPISRNRVVVE
jgi:hypothetical protein